MENNLRWITMPTLHKARRFTLTSSLICNNLCSFLKVSILLKLLISHVVTLGLNMCPSNMVRAQFVSMVLELTFILEDHNHSCFERQYFQPVRHLTLHANNSREKEIEGRSQTCIRREIYSSHCYIPFFTNLYKRGNILV